ncbi:MAG: PTS sugar transporter subunit IIA [Planctomycetota bacterium]
MEDFDVKSLAAYLHLTPDQVKKAAMRGKLPGRRVGGDWRFNPSDIHHWMEERIGEDDGTSLDQYDRMLDRAEKKQADVEAPPQISRLCSVDSIEVPLKARTRGSVIREICKVAARTGTLWDPSAMAEAVATREQMHPTALDCGVALLHPRRPQTSILADSLIALAVCSSPIPFSNQGHETDVFFLICSYDDRSHLRILARLSRILTSTPLLGPLREASDANTAWRVLQEAEDSLDS